ncbi:putative glucan endo-1,3-beta-glucosidase A6 [Hibiscus syriacus]|uniref:glucan endo-1,3-beta-D-glucosidase n=1 Tax=Hibiscus syriacus TaxID=106335 RepID=A0A6A3CQR9_HIBSY|nr:putative glucan endo-1,3-beta-glucosidase A6 [Hibiscus syriacus]
MSTMAALLATILFSSLIAVFSADISSKIGVNYGRKGVNLPSPYRTIETQCLEFLPDTMIRFVLVGNEVLSHDRRIWPSLVPAMRRIKNSLNAHDIKNIKVSTPLAMDVLQSTFPPSSGEFRSDIRDTVMAPFLGFLNGTKSFFFIDAYPYLAWSTNSRNISLDFALFRGRVNQTDHKTGLVYTNLLDQMLDSVIFAMRKLGYPGIRLTIGETGWPTAGDADQTWCSHTNIHFLLIRRKPKARSNNREALGAAAFERDVGADASNLTSALAYACRQGNQTCAALSPGNRVMSRYRCSGTRVMHSARTGLSFGNKVQPATSMA